MRTITINNKEYQVIDDLKELTLTKFENISKYSSEKNDPVDMAIKIAKELFVDEITIDEVENMDTDDLFNLVGEINRSDEYELQQTIEVEGDTYKLDGDATNFTFKVKQIKTISDAMKLNSYYYISKMAAILYVNDKSNQNQREIIFNRSMTADVIMPLLKLIITKYGS